MSLKISYLDHLLCAVTLLKKQLPSSKFNPLRTFWVIEKQNQCFSKDSSAKKGFTHVQFLKKIPILPSQNKKNTPKMQKRYTCHVSYKKFISINNLICSTLPIQTRYSLSNLIKFNNQSFSRLFIFGFFFLKLQIKSLRIVRYIIRKS